LPLPKRTTKKSDCFVRYPFLLLKLITPRQMLRLLNPLNKLLLLHASLTFHSPIQQNTLELLHPQLGQILDLQILRLDGEFDRTNFRIVFGDAFAQSIRGHAEGEGLSDVAFDGVDVVADFLFSGREFVVGAVCAYGGFDFWFYGLVWFGHGGADVGHDFHAD
jgi:hypothetical protein